MTQAVGAPIEAVRERRHMTSTTAAEIGASCFTGAAVIAITNPLDCLKQRWQVEPADSAHRSLTSFTRNIVRQEGIINGLWRPGIVVNSMACTISVGTRLGLYPLLRDSIAKPSESTPRSGFSMFASGLLGGALGYLAAAPFFCSARMSQTEAGLINADGVYATGMRKGKPPTASGSSSGLSMLLHLGRQHGVPGLWRASEVLIARGAIMSATQLFTYDQVKGRVRAGGVPDGPALHCVASLAASLTLTTAICPFDVVYTAHLAGPSLGRPYSSPAACGAALLREGGPLALFRGWVPLWVCVVSCTCTCTCTHAHAPTHSPMHMHPRTCMHAHMDAQLHICICIHAQVRFLPSSVLTFVIYEQSRRLLLGSYLQ